MEKNILRLALLVLTVVFALNVIPVQAWPTTRAVPKILPKKGYQWGTIAKPLAVFGLAAGALLGSLWLTKKICAHYSRPAATNVPTAQNPPAPARSPFYSRAFHWLKTRVSNLFHHQACPLPANPPPAIADSLIALAQETRGPVEGYQAATDTELAIVPAFNDQQNLVIEPMQCENPHDHARVTVQQVRVVDQFDDQAMGGASCGYQAIKNACGLTGLTRGQNANILLNDVDTAIQLLGLNPQGAFRQIVDHRNKRLALRNLLISQLIHAPRNPAPQEDIANMRIAYTRLLDAFLNQQINIIERGGNAEINEHAITAFIAQSQIPNIYEGNERTAQEIENLHQTRVAFLRNPQNISRYIVLQNPIHLTHEDFDNAIINYNGTVRTNDLQHEHIPGNGELLRSDGIECVINMRRQMQGSVLNSTLGDAPVIVLDSTEQPAAAVPGEPSFHPLEINETTAQLRNCVRDHVLPPERLYAFVLGSGDQATRADSHWIAMTLEITNGRRRYTIAESAGNQLYSMFRGPARNVIRFIEGNEINNVLKPTQGAKQRASQELVDCLRHCEQSYVQNLLELQHAMLNYVHLQGDFSEFKDPAAVRQRVDTQLDRLEKE